MFICRVLQEQIYICNKGGDKRKRKWRGEERGRLFEGGDYLKYFGQRGAINRGTAIIRGNTVINKLPESRQSCCGLSCFFFCFWSDPLRRVGTIIILPMYHAECC